MHDNDESIEAGCPYFAAAWPVEGAARFRFFRIHQHEQVVGPPPPTSEELAQAAAAWAAAHPE